MFSESGPDNALPPSRGLMRQVAAESVSLSEFAAMPAVVDAALSTVDAAIQSAADARQSEANAAAQDRAIRHRQYLEILVRAKTPKAGDDAKLAELILSLGLTTEDVRRDSSRIEQAAEKIAAVEKQQEAEDAFAAAFKATNDMRDRHRQELKAANDTLNRARSEASRIGWYERELCELYAAAPELFADGLLTVPPSVARQVSGPPVAAPVVRQELQLQRYINGRMVEPLIDPDGRYRRDERGQYVFPAKQAPDPLLDDTGRPRTDARGQFIFEEQAPVSPDESPVTLTDEPES